MIKRECLFNKKILNKSTIKYKFNDEAHIGKIDNSENDQFCEFSVQ